MTSARPSLLRILALLALITGPALSPAAAHHGTAPRTTPQQAAVSELSLTVSEPAGVDRRQALVRGGIPFPQGDLPSAAQARVLAGTDEIPADFHALATWEDGSVRWLLIEFQDDFPAGQEKAYQLQYGPGVSRGSYATRLMIEADNPQDPGWVTVDTGSLFVRIDKSTGSLFREIRYQGTPWIEGAQTWNGAFTDGSGGVSRMAIGSIELEEGGPISATIRLTDRESGKNFFTDLRLTFFAGSGDIQIEHTSVVATKNTAKSSILKEIGITLPLVPMPDTYELGAVGGETRATAFTGAQKWLEQSSWDRYQLEGIALNGSFPAYAALMSESASLLVSIQDWWQTFPKQLVLDPASRSLTAYLWRGQSRTLYENVEDPPGPGAEAPGNPQGVAKSHRLLLSFGPPDRSSEALRARALAFDQPLLLQAPPGWNTSTGALYLPVLPYQGLGSRMEAALRILLQGITAAQQRFHIYGFWDFGDIRGEYGDCSEDEISRGLCPEGWRSTGRYGWRNGNIDIQQALLLGYFRTGERSFFSHGEAMARHVRDVDTVHYIPSSPSDLGGTHRHNREHWGEYGFGPKYTSVDGIILYYYLTGDLRTKEVLEQEMGPFHLAQSPSEWHMTLAKLMGFWTMTRDARYWNAIQQIMEGNGRSWPGLKRMDPAKVADVYSYGQSSYSGVSSRGVPGLWHYWLLTGDQAIPAMLEAMFQTTHTTSLTGDFSFQQSWDRTYLGALFDSTGDPQALNRLLHETLSEIDGLFEEGRAVTGHADPSQIGMTPETWWHLLSPLDVSVHYRMLGFNLGTLVKHGAAGEAHIDRLLSSYRQAVNAGDLALAAKGAVASTNDFYSDDFPPARAIDGLISTDPGTNSGSRNWKGGNRWRSKGPASAAAPVTFTVSFPQPQEVAAVQIDTLNYRQNGPSDFSLLCDEATVVHVTDNFDAYRTVDLGTPRRCATITVRTTASNSPNTFVALNELRAFGPGYQAPDLTGLLSPSPAPTFADVPFEHPYRREIEALYRAGYTAGCATHPLRYCPEQTMNRAESAVFVERGTRSTTYDPPAPISQVFADLSLDSWAAGWVNSLWEDRYTAGCGTDPLVYCPWQGHTRAEGCVFYLRMLRGADFAPPTPTSQVFADVPLDAWFAAWAHEAYAAGLLEPCQAAPHLRFCPDDPLTRALAGSMMVRAKGLPLDP